jgi:hypothetical protein
LWWDILAERFGGIIPEAVRVRALSECAGREEQVAASFGLRATAVSLPAYCRTASEEELTKAVLRGGICVAPQGFALRLAGLFCG